MKQYCPTCAVNLLPQSVFDNYLTQILVGFMSLANGQRRRWVVVMIRRVLFDDDVTTTKMFRMIS